MKTLSVQSLGSRTIAKVALVALACCSVNGVFGQTNLALNQPAGASSCSVSSTNWDPSYATNGNTSGTTYWSASTASFPQWLTVDLGAICTLTSATNIFFNSNNTWKFQIQGSNNNSTFTVLYDGSSGVYVSGNSVTETISGKYRYVRLYVIGSSVGYWASSDQFEVYGSVLSQTRSVPTPSAIGTGSYQVGCQMCNIWTSGANSDWDTIINYPDRLSVMGEYDEAYDVATDWQIKMAVEHGISFFLTCWYRELDNNGQKDVLSTFDQFINSISKTAEYKADMQWAIMWDNQNGVGAEPGASPNKGESAEQDFLDASNFWITNYFGKSNYLRINHYPVVSIFDLATLATQLGSVSNVQSAITSFRNTVTSTADPNNPGHNYPGVIIMGVTGRIPSGLASYIDYQYQYSNGTNGTTLSYFQSQFNGLGSGSPKNIVAPTSGWDSAPWYSYGEHYGPTYRFNPTDYKTELGYAKTAMGGSGMSGLSNTMVLLDNWNEYAEGHFIAPTQGNGGFGYLDGIASVFAGNNSPNDTMPVLSNITQVYPSPIAYWIQNVGDSNLITATSGPSYSNGDLMIEEPKSGTNGSASQNFILAPEPSDIGYYTLESSDQNYLLSQGGSAPDMYNNIAVQFYQSCKTFYPPNYPLQLWTFPYNPGSSQYNIIELGNGGAPGYAWPITLASTTPNNGYPVFVHGGSDGSPNQQLWTLNAINPPGYLTGAWSD